MDRPQPVRGGQRDVAWRGEGTDWCVMSMLSGPLRMTRFPPTPAILLSRDWAQVSVTCGRASGAACDRTCSCTKLGAMVGCEERRANSRAAKCRGEKSMSARETSRIISVNLISSHLFFTSPSPLHSFSRPQWTPSSSQRSRRTPHPSPATHPPLSPPPRPLPSSAPPTPQTGNSTCPKTPAPARRRLPRKSLSSTRTQTFSG